MFVWLYIQAHMHTHTHRHIWTNIHIFVWTVKLHTHTHTCQSLTLSSLLFCDLALLVIRSFIYSPKQQNRKKKSNSSSIAFIFFSSVVFLSFFFVVSEFDKKSVFFLLQQWNNFLKMRLFVAKHLPWHIVSAALDNLYVNHIIRPLYYFYLIHTVSHTVVHSSIHSSIQLFVFHSCIEFTYIHRHLHTYMCTKDEF